MTIYEVSNARTEGFNRIIKQTKGVGCGYPNMINYQRRILSHIVVTRPQSAAARPGPTPLKFVEPVIRVVMGSAPGRRSFIDRAIAGH